MRAVINSADSAEVDLSEVTLFSHVISRSVPSSSRSAATVKKGIGVAGGRVHGLHLELVLDSECDLTSGPAQGAPSKSGATAVFHADLETLANVEDRCCGLYHANNVRRGPGGGN